MTNGTIIRLISLAMAIPTLLMVYAAKVGTDYQLDLSVIVFTISFLIGLLFYWKYQFMDKRMIQLMICLLLLFVFGYFYTSYY